MEEFFSQFHNELCRPGECTEASCVSVAAVMLCSWQTSDAPQSADSTRKHDLRIYKTFLTTSSVVFHHKV